MSKRRFGPMVPGDRGLVGPRVNSFTVGSWVSNQNSMSEGEALDAEKRDRRGGR